MMQSPQNAGFPPRSAAAPEKIGRRHAARDAGFEHDLGPQDSNASALARIDPHVLARNEPRRHRELSGTRRLREPQLGVGGLLGGLDVDAERSLGRSSGREAYASLNPAPRVTTSPYSEDPQLARATRNAQTAMPFVINRLLIRCLFSFEGASLSFNLCWSRPSPLTSKRRGGPSRSRRTRALQNSDLSFRSCLGLGHSERAELGQFS
jgi:hypothetical protein